MWNRKEAAQYQHEIMNIYVYRIINSLTYTLYCTQYLYYKFECCVYVNIKSNRYMWNRKEAAQYLQEIMNFCIYQDMVSYIINFDFSIMNIQAIDKASEQKIAV
jgi:hypothetical protein